MRESFPNPYATPSFQFPVLPPTEDPDAEPLHAVNINCQWLPYVRGALFQMALQATWKSDDPAAVLLAQRRAMTLISAFDECAGGSELPFACAGDLTATASPFGTWSTNVLGMWLPFIGWDGTCCHVLATHHYAGVELLVTLDNPVHLSNVHLVYDLTKGESGDPADFGIDVFDPVAPGTIRAATLGSLVDGPNQHFDSGAWGPALSQVGIHLYSAISIDHDPFPEGNCALTAIILSGTASVPPC